MALRPEDSRREVVSPLQKEWWLPDRLAWVGLALRVDFEMSANVRFQAESGLVLLTLSFVESDPNRTSQERCR